MYKIHVTDLNEMKQRLRTEWAKLDNVVIAAAIRQWCCELQISDACLYIFSCNISYMLLSTEFKSVEFGHWKTQLRWEI